MLRIVTGPFHPTLEQALVDEVRSLKAGDPFLSLAIVVPSVLLAERLKRLLALESQLSLLNLYVLTFHQFALRLRDDLAAGDKPPPAMQLVEEFYFEQLVRQVVKRKLPGLEVLSRLSPSAGTWRGLWATVRDLKDAVVVPATALKAVEEGVFEEDDGLWLRSLFALQTAVLEASRSLAVGSPDDLLASLEADLPRSTFLNGLGRICYYGFYDLLQVQLSFFETMTRNAPVTLYFPLEAAPAYDFARRFFERHLLPLAQTHDDRGRAAATVPVLERTTLSVRNVMGTGEELAAVCREILTLVEVHGYRFDDIGVVARSLEPYQARLQSVFDRHLVPFTSTAGQPVTREPLVKALLRLISLPLNDFERTAFLDVIASPFYRIPGEIEPRPDLWRFYISRLGIAQGKVDWSRLAAPETPTILQLAAGEADEESDCGSIYISDHRQLSLLSDLAARLIQDCEGLPRRGSIGRLTEAMLRLVERHFSIPGWTVQDAQPTGAEVRAVLVGSLIKRAIQRVSDLDALEADLSWEEWADLFRQALEETVLPVEGESHQGVQVLDAMQARGLRFRALFVLGLNEQVFPRFIREDPFLLDRHREVLESTLGFVIEEKLSGHDEERLLFELLSRAGTDRLYLSYLRADEEGRVMAVSPLLERAMHDERFTAGPEAIVARRLTTRVSQEPAIQEVLPIQDLGVSLLLHNQNAGPLFDDSGLDRRLCEQALAVQEVMERDSPDLGPFDGLLGPETTARSLFDQEGLSPTALERYACCPFRYFMEKVLCVKPVRVLPQDSVPALTMGTLVHETLRRSYERLTASHWPVETLDQAAIHELISNAAAEVFAGHAAAEGTGHMLLWILAQEQVVALVRGVVAADEEDYRSTGFRPHAFETKAEGVLSLGSMADLKIKGKLDRLDVRDDPPGLRIVDYKFKQGHEMASQDRNLLVSALRGSKLQPPLYGCMTIPSRPPTEEVRFVYLAPRWEEPIAHSRFQTSGLLGHTGERIKQTVRTLVQGIERREFFILPDGYCDYCDFPSVCRRHDSSTWWRSYRSPEARVLRRMRKQKVDDE